MALRVCSAPLTTSPCALLAPGFSAQPLFTSGLIAMFNVIFTSAPTVAFAVLEQDVSMVSAQTHGAAGCSARTRVWGLGARGVDSVLPLCFCHQQHFDGTFIL